MSEGRSMPLPLARARAQKLLTELLPHVARAELVGSIRRRRPEAHDIEILAEPRTRVEPDLFHPESVPEIEPIAAALAQRGTVKKSGDRYIQVLLGHPPYPPGRPDERTKADVFLCHPPADWGVLEVIRTGPADFGKLLVKRLRKKGWRCWKGSVWRLSDGTRAALGDDPGRDPIGPERWERVPCPTERDFFAACDLEYLEPERRDLFLRHYLSLKETRR